MRECKVHTSDSHDTAEFERSIADPMSFIRIAGLVNALCEFECNVRFVTPGDGWCVQFY